MRILVIGDSHGDTVFIKLMQQKAVALECDQIIQLGDFGYFPRLAEGAAFLEAIKGGQVPLYFIQGNHDGLWDLASYRHADEPIEVVDNVFYLPQGYRWQVGVWELLALGGATSIDAHLRTQGVDWFPEECISYADTIKATIEGGTVDIMFTHDCPTSVEDVVLGKRTSLGIGQADRIAIQQLVDSMRVKKLFHGHWHVKHHTFTQKLKVYGLGCNYVPEQAYEVLEL